LTQIESIPMWKWFKETFTGPMIIFIGKRIVDPKFTKSPIIIGGCARSGTTLLLAILSANPYILAIPKETDSFTMWNRRKNKLYPVRLDRFYRKFLTFSVPKITTRWVEKRPDNVYFISEILNYYGADSRFIHILRDPRAVCCSIHPSVPGDYWVEPERWVKAVTAGLKFKDHPQVLTLRYEDLIMNNEQAIRSICNFINEVYTDQMKNWEKFVTIKNSTAWKKPFNAIQTDKIYLWKHPKHQDRLEYILKNQELIKLMTELGYY
jgi:hypothetical protein